MKREEILSRNPIVPWLRERGVELAPSRDNFIADTCPVKSHQKPGHKPVMIYPATQTWTCHDCRKTGSVIDWLMHEKGVTAGEAMKELSGDEGSSCNPVANY